MADRPFVGGTKGPYDENFEKVFVRPVELPVHYHEGGWYFWDETSDRQGPYPNAELATDAYHEYCAGLNTEKPPE